MNSSNNYIKKIRPINLWSFASCLLSKKPLFILPNQKIPIDLINELKKLDSYFSEKKISHPDVYHDGGWRIFPLRSISDDVSLRAGKFKWFDGYENYIYLNKFIDSLGSDLRRVRLMTLLPGGNVNWHFDRDESFDSDVIRMHLVISSNNNAFIQICHEKYFFKPGNFFIGDFGFPHRVKNKGKTDRTHLVIDIAKNKIHNKELLEELNYYGYKNKFSLKVSRFLYEPYNFLFTLKRLCVVIKSKNNEEGIFVFVYKKLINFLFK